MKNQRDSSDRLAALEKEWEALKQEKKAQLAELERRHEE